MSIPIHNVHNRPDTFVHPVLKKHFIRIYLLFHKEQLCSEKLCLYNNFQYNNTWLWKDDNLQFNLNGSKSHLKRKSMPPRESNILEEMLNQKFISKEGLEPPQLKGTIHNIEINYVQPSLTNQLHYIWLSYIMVFVFILNLINVFYPTIR